MEQTCFLEFDNQIMNLVLSRFEKLIHSLYGIMTRLCHHRVSDLQFLVLMKHLTDLNERHIYLMFDVFDFDGSGSLDFDEFYLIMCILTAIKVGIGSFVNSHSSFSCGNLTS